MDFKASVVGKLPVRRRSKSINMARMALVVSVTGVVFLLSLMIGPMHYDGDQLHYTDAYHSVVGLEFLDAYDEYRRYIDSAEFVHFVVVWAAANFGFDKNIVMSASNAVLANLLARLFLRWGVRGWLTLIFCFTNFYILVLYFTTERLKFAFIFILLSALYWNRLPLRLAFLATAAFAHFQVLIGYSGVALLSLRRGRLVAWSSHAQWIWVFFGVCSVAVVWYVIGDFIGSHIVAKVSTYSTLNTKDLIVDSLVMVFFFAATLHYSSKRLEVILVFAPLFVVLAVIGSDRVNMVGYCVFAYYALRVSGGVNVAILGTSIYLMGKGTHYLYYLFTVGNGFGY